MSVLQSTADGRRVRARSPIADWPLWLLGATLCTVFAAQIFVLQDHAWDFGLSAAAIKQGRWWTLFTSMFIHGGLWHLVMNLSALSLGQPLLRRFGDGLRGPLLFFLLYFLCGLAGGLVFLAINFNGEVPAVGASGALFGLWGALARTGLRNEPLKPLFSKEVGSQLWEATRQNLIFIALLFGFSLLNSGRGPRIAWEAHAGGFLAGLLLVGPILSLARPLAAEPETLTGRIKGQFGDETFDAVWILRADEITLTAPAGTQTGTVNPLEMPEQAAQRLLAQVYGERGRGP